MNLNTFKARRRLTAWLSAAIILGLPFLRISNESALRFDIPSLRLYFFGSVFWISEAYFFLLILLLFFIGIMLFTVLFGRIWCGWMCPQTVLSDFTRSLVTIANRLTGHPAIRTIISHALILLFSLVVSTNLIGYFVSPYQLFKNIMEYSLGPWTTGAWTFFTVLVYLNLAFVRQRFCGSICPYARLQSAFFDHATLTIGFDRSRDDECMQCEACVRDCPMGIDIREGLQVECINCAECIDACARQTAVQNRKPLIRYLFGEHGEAVHGKKRPRVAGLSIAFAVLASVFAYQVYLRVPVDFFVLPSEAQAYHQTGFKGTLLNAYDLFVENRSLEPEEYHLSVSGVKDAELVILNNPFVIPRDTALHTQVYVLVKRKNLSDRITQLRFTLESTKTPEIKIIREAPFVYPERTDKGVEI
jgi:cytochrome c oxidase accessory protein FixG